MFQLTEEEKEEVVTNCDHLKTLKILPVLLNLLQNLYCLTPVQFTDRDVGVADLDHLCREAFNIVQ